MRILLYVLLVVLAEMSRAQETDEESRLLRRKIRKICRILGQGRELSDEEARTLVFLQVQQVQGYPGTYGGGPSHTSSDALGGLCSSFGDGGGGGLLGGSGGLLGGVLGSPVRPEPPLGSISQLGDIFDPPRRANRIGVRPERYVRQFYRYLNRLFK